MQSPQYVTTHPVQSNKRSIETFFDTSSKKVLTEYEQNELLTKKRFELEKELLKTKLELKEVSLTQKKFERKYVELLQDFCDTDIDNLRDINLRKLQMTLPDNLVWAVEFFERRYFCSGQTSQKYSERIFSKLKKTVKREVETSERSQRLILLKFLK